MAETAANDRITAAQLNLFDREGHAVIDGLLDDADLQPVIDEIQTEVQTRAQALVREGKLSRTYDEFGFERQLTMISRETDAVALAIWSGVLSGPAFFNLIRNEKLLDVAEALCGPELIASSVYRLRPKVPGHCNGPVPWHQDSGYFEPYCDKSLVLTYWIPLVDATRENGCMWVIPGVHKSEALLKHQGRQKKWYLEIPESALPPVKPICVPVRKGGVLLLSNRTPHASFENTTEVTRWSMDLRYQSAALPTNAKISRAPGEAVSGGAVPVACYPPEADFLVRSRLRPGEVVTDPAEFHRLRSTHVAMPVTGRWAVV
ncbi:MAG TPA: phytanoyl-CoA dioxygenase family protein [Planctomycetota bacterium]|nr:phytanoyl-CoA dioxygenase family protein [Planctomycetota bacterium]